MIFFPLQNCAVQKEIHWTFNKPCFVLFFQRPSTLLQIQRRKPCFKIHPRQMCTPNYKSWPLKILPVSLVTIFNAWLIPFLEVENSREASVLLVVLLFSFVDLFLLCALSCSATKKVIFFNAVWVFMGWAEPDFIFSLPKMIWFHRISKGRTYFNL